MQPDSLCVTPSENPKCWRLTQGTDANDSGEAEEIVLCIRGIITMKDLPPITEFM